MAKKPTTEKKAEASADEAPTENSASGEPLPNLNSFGPGAVPLEQR